MKVHRPRDVACPLCGDRRFDSDASAVSHIEAGSCTKCSGRDRAREEIYKYVSSTPHAQQYLSDQLAIGGGYHGGYGSVPDTPYACQECARDFKSMSSLMQHTSDKHSRGVGLQLGY